jgi:hypothetical protein
MDKEGGSTILYGKDVRTNMNKAEHDTYDDDEFFINFKMHRRVPHYRPPQSHVQLVNSRKHPSLSPPTLKQ